jgi:membrane dipeptidase
MTVRIVDAHLDFAYNAVIKKRDLRLPIAQIRRQEQQAPPTPAPYTGCLASLPEMRGKIAVFGGSLFVEPASEESEGLPVYHTPQEAHQQAIDQLDYYHRLADEDETISLLYKAADLATVLSGWPQPRPRLGIFIIMEGADPILTPDELTWWVEQGVRGIMPSWALGTRYAGGNNAPGPFTALGKELLKRMAQYPLLLDLSHLGEEAAWEALEKYPGPLAASHANPRAFVDRPRMLSDAMLRRLAERDGVIGLIPYNRMLQSEWKIGTPRLPLQRFIEAIDHVCQCIGDAAHVGLGSDYDGGFGVESVPEPLDTIGDLVILEQRLQQRGYSPRDIAAILGDNWLRLMQTALQPF